MKKLIVTALILAVGICIGASNAWADDPPPLVTESDAYDFEGLDIGTRLGCGNEVFDKDNEQCDPTDNTGQWVANPPNPTDAEIMDMCKEGTAGFDGSETNIECLGCKCFACGDKSWDHNMGEQCDGTSTTPEDVVRQCKESYAMAGVSPIPAGIENATCENCICVFCGNGLLDPGEECDKGTPLLPQIAGTASCKDGTCDGATCQCIECGDGVLDPGEDCDPGITDPNDPDYFMNDSVCGAICDPDTQIIVECTEPDPITGRGGCKCLCEDILETCGNGFLDPGEDCSNHTNDPNLDPNQWLDITDPITGIDEIKMCDPGEQCALCKCSKAPVCGNGTIEAGEECETGAGNECKDSEGNVDPEAICSINCTCEDEPPPDCPPQDCPDCCDDDPTPNVGKYACSIEIDGFSSPGHKKLITKDNERFMELIEGTNIASGSKLVAEAGFSTVQIVLRAKDTVADDETKFATGKAQSGDGLSYGNWAWLALSGTPPIDFMARKFKPATKVYFDKPTRIFPILPQDLVAAGISASVAGVPSGLKAMTLPDLSSSLSGIDLGLTGPVQVDNVTTAMGGADINIQSSEAYNWRLNNVITLELKPGMSVNKATAGEGIGDTMVVWKAIVEPDRASWTGPEGRPILMPHEKEEDLWIENRTLDYEEIMSIVEERVAQCKAGAGPCDCSILLNLPWEQNLNYQYLFVQDTVKAEHQTGVAKTAKSTGAVPTNSIALGVGHIAKLGGVGRGGGGMHCDCNMNTVMPPVSHLALWLGMGLSGLAGMVAVRRRRK